jgi:hypothetical protein
MDERISAAKTVAGERLWFSLVLQDSCEGKNGVAVYSFHNSNTTSGCFAHLKSMVVLFDSHKRNKGNLLTQIFCFRMWQRKTLESHSVAEKRFADDSVHRWNW